MKDLIIGIDLGTTNSLVAFCDERGPRVIPSPAGRRLCPSIVCLAPGRLSVGETAQTLAAEFPAQTVFSVKRLMGKSVADVQADLPHLPYRVGPAAADNPAAYVLAGGRAHSPQEISARILAELKGWAEAHFQKPITKAVITVPAYFDDAQRQATRDAGAIAGLEVLRIVNEPTAAALAYGLDRARDATIAVYDLGGGTFDISILRIQNGVFEVLSTGGDTHLGGDDFDRAVMTELAEDICRQFAVDVSLDPALQHQLRQAAEAARIALSDATTATVTLELGQGRTFSCLLSREELEGRIAPLIARTLEKCERALRDAGKTAGDIERVVMVGGATRTPAVRREVGAFFQTEAYTALDPMEVVALGAAVQAGILAGVRRDLLLLDIVPLSLGIETVGGAVAHLIPKGTHVPAQAQDLFTTSVDGQTSVKIHVVQGERPLVKDCRSLAQFTLTDVPPMPAGIPQLLVDFLVDANGILSVSATELRSAREASVQVLPSHGLRRQEVDKMVRQGLLAAAEDGIEAALVELWNRIDFDTRAVEKTLAIAGDAIEPAYRRELEEIIEGLRQMRGWRDAEGVARALLYLDRKAAPLAEKAMTIALNRAVET